MDGPHATPRLSANVAAIRLLRCSAVVPDPSCDRVTSPINLPSTAKLYSTTLGYVLQLRLAEPCSRVMAHNEPADAAANAPHRARRLSEARPLSRMQPQCHTTPSTSRAESSYASCKPFSFATDTRRNPTLHAALRAAGANRELRVSPLPVGHSTWPRTDRPTAAFEDDHACVVPVT